MNDKYEKGGARLVLGTSPSECARAEEEDAEARAIHLLRPDADSIRTGTYILQQEIDAIESGLRDERNHDTTWARGARVLADHLKACVAYLHGTETKPENT